MHRIPLIENFLVIMLQLGKILGIFSVSALFLGMEQAFAQGDELGKLWSLPIFVIVAAVSFAVLYLTVKNSKGKLAQN